MIDYQCFLEQEILRLKGKKEVDFQVWLKFAKRVKNKKGLTKKENPQDHFCIFFLPLDVAKKSVYLGHHIKADDWLPPGGHLERGETPYQTIKRECKEELRYNLKSEKIQLFNLSIKKITNPKFSCKRHWDIWYLIYLKKRKFNFLKKEFYNACWFKLDKKNFPLTKNKNQRKILQKISSIFLL